MLAEFIWTTVKIVAYVIIGIIVASIAPHVYHGRVDDVDTIFLILAWPLPVAFAIIAIIGSVLFAVAKALIIVLLAAVHSVRHLF